MQQLRRKVLQERNDIISKLLTDSSAPSYKKEQEYENEAFEPDETRQDEEAPPRYSESQSYKATTF